MSDTMKAYDTLTLALAEIDDCVLAADCIIPTQVDERSDEIRALDLLLRTIRRHRKEALAAADALYEAVTELEKPTG